jgi:hypothetical protein
MIRLKTISKAQENEMTISQTSETEHVRATVVENLETQSNVNFVEKMMVDSLTNVGNTCSDSEFNLEPRRRDLMFVQYSVRCSFFLWNKFFKGYVIQTVDYICFNFHLATILQKFKY